MSVGGGRTLTAVLLAVTVALALRGHHAGWVAVAIGLAVAPLASALGVFVSRRPQVAVVGGLLSLLGSRSSRSWRARPGSRSSPLARPAGLGWLVAGLDENAWWGYATVALLLLHFPDGKLPSRRWRWVPPALVAGPALTQAHGAFDDNAVPAAAADLARPFGPPPIWIDALAGFFPMLVLGCAGRSLVIRFRRADLRSAPQIKWLALAGSAFRSTRCCAWPRSSSGVARSGSAPPSGWPGSSASPSPPPSPCCTTTSTTSTRPLPPR